MTKQLDEAVIHDTHYDQIMETMQKEPYANHLGIRLTGLGKGTASAELVIEDYMLNAHGTVHGAVMFALADYVFAAASNSYGKVSVGLSTNMNFMAPGLKGSILTATATEAKKTRRIAWYRIAVESEGNLLATMEATVYRKEQFFVPVDEDK
ncbi:PaaI family thioesterase [Bacillus thermotolerans]|uniref:PaaI family thioesterase n=1 Tax=Bacillus thermotolerans TaxID=1221996 RepID=UPI000588F437|nr:hotdog fold thioesterase [Bacillus thermotolerans]KKB43031.1 Phenylacetic acid degradation protein PaaD, thioesterase [Bacillus thermotolerans]